MTQSKELLDSHMRASTGRDSWNSFLIVTKILPYVVEFRSIFLLNKQISIRGSIHICMSSYVKFSAIRTFSTFINICYKIHTISVVSSAPTADVIHMGMLPNQFY